MNRPPRPVRFRDLSMIAFVFLVCIGLAAVQFGVDAHSYGRTGSSTSGCTCHGTSPSQDVTVSITGLPAGYTPGSKYTLSVKITGGPAPGGVNQGGFDLSVSDGFLSVPSGSTAVQISAGEATHTTDGNDQRQWDVDWTAPAAGKGPVTFNVAGNSVNGDGANTGDKWNKATYTVPEAVVADTVRPAITITSPTEGKQFPQGTTQVQVSGTASDNIGVVSVEISKDGSSWVAATGTTSWSASISVQPGSTSIQARAKDAANNIGTARVNITVQVASTDTQAPSITITSPTEATSYPAGTTQVDISGTAGDDVGVTKVEVSNDGQNWVQASGTTSWTAKIGVQTGANKLQARAMDAAANLRLRMVNITVESQALDQVPPQISITNPNQGQVLAANTTLTTAIGTASDNVGVQMVEVSMDGKTWAIAVGNTSWSIQISVKVGPNTVQARALDTSGNTALATVSFTVAAPPPPPDKIGPNLSIDSPAEGASFPFGTKDIQVSGSVSDNRGVKEVRVSTDGTNYQKATGNTTWTYTLAVETGTYKLTIQAEDFSKNIDTHNINFTVRQDTTSPTLVITSHSSGATLPPGTKEIILTGQSSDNDRVMTVEVSEDNSTWLPATGTSPWSATVKVSPGKNMFYVRSTDANGNMEYAKVEIKVTVPKSNLWPVHVIVQVLTIMIALGVWTIGWRIRRDKTKRPAQEKARRRRMHILAGPVFTTVLVVGFLGGLINRYLVRGVVITSPHGYLAVITIILYIMGSMIGSYMAARRPTDGLRKAHLILQTTGTLCLATTITLGTLLAFDLRLL